MKIMKNEKLNAALVWKQFEDDVVPQLRLSVIDRAVYSHLLRHSRLEGKPRIRFPVSWLAHGTRLCVGSTRPALHRLFDKGALRLVECSKEGHVVHVRLPEEIRGVRASKIAAGPPRVVHAVNLEGTDFLQYPGLRRAIHGREGGQCFYCLRRLVRRRRCLDHVVPRAMLGRNSYRDLVSCCHDCNSKKKDRPAEEFFGRLYRERNLSADELRRRLRALDDLAAGKLKPPLPGQA
jgi:5-methylcytosine-specific restriction endonuclease McrA